MTEKRFTVKQRQGATIYSIIDYYGELPLSEGMYYKSNAEKLCKWLNNQHELLNAFCKENEELKQQLQEKHQDLTELGLKYGDIIDIKIANEVIENQRKHIKKAEKENEQLKGILLDMLETSMETKTLREVYCDGVLRIFDKANSLNQAREMIKEHLK